MYNLWCIISIAIPRSAKTTNVTCSIPSNCVHEFVPIIVNSICCTPQVLRASTCMSLLWDFHNIRVHCIVFVTILCYDMNFIF